MQPDREPMGEVSGRAWRESPESCGTSRPVALTGFPAASASGASTARSSGETRLRYATLDLPAGSGSDRARVRRPLSCRPIGLISFPSIHAIPCLLESWWFGERRADLETVPEDSRAYASG